MQIKIESKLTFSFVIKMEDDNGEEKTEINERTGISEAALEEVAAKLRKIGDEINEEYSCINVAIPKFTDWIRPQTLMSLFEALGI